MSINLIKPSDSTPQLKPRITVIGVGGAGGNAVNNMIDKELEGVDFVVANTDAQALSSSKTESRVQLGVGVTEGLGAGSRPEVGRAAAEESLIEIDEQIRDSHMVFIAAGMGGGTGTGAAPVVARAAKEKGILTVGVITKPFQFEGIHRQKIAVSGIEDLEQFVDTLIVIPNQNLFRVANEQTTFADAFNMADEVLHSGVRGVTDLMVMPGLINLDFADIRSVMSEMGKAMMGTGEAEGERRAIDAAEAAISNPLLDDCSMAGAKGVLINITGGQDLTLFEADEAANRIRSEVDEDAHISFGSTFDDSLAGKIRVSVVATGMDREAIEVPTPTFLSVSQNVIPSERQYAKEKALIPEPVRPVASDSVDNNKIDDVLSASDSSQEISEAPNLEIPSGVSNQNFLKEQPTGEDLSENIDEGLDVKVNNTNNQKEESFAQPSEPVVASPGHNMSDAFIPEIPMSPSGEKVIEVADPFAAAAMTNGSKSSDLKSENREPVAKKQSLFERVTGIASSSDDTPETNTEESKAKTSMPSRMTDPGPKTTENQVQNKLGTIDKSERLAASQEETDPLDIPAFLRRQAN